MMKNLQIKISDLVYIFVILSFSLLSLFVGLYFIYFSDVRNIVDTKKTLESVYNVAFEVKYYYREKSVLPKSLEDLHARLNRSLDAYTKNLKYRPSDDGTRYQICAHFKVGSDTLDKYNNYPHLRSNEPKLDFSGGYRCFDFQAKI